jgi:hypothetical protein
MQGLGATPPKGLRAADGTWVLTRPNSTLRNFRKKKE